MITSCVTIYVVLFSAESFIDTPFYSVPYSSPNISLVVSQASVIIVEGMSVSQNFDICFSSTLCMTQYNGGAETEEELSLTRILVLTSCTFYTETFRWY